MRGVLQHPFLAPNVPLSFVHERPPDSRHLMHEVSSEVGNSYNLALTSSTITDKTVQEYIDAQEGEPVHDDSQFPVDSP